MAPFAVNTVCTPSWRIKVLFVNLWKGAMGPIARVPSQIVRLGLMKR